MGKDNWTGDVGQTGGVRGGLRALVVDDSTTMRRLMGITLERLGMEVEFADHGNDAVALTKSRGYDIVFLDVMLPDIDGYRVCKTIKDDARTRHTAVIMLTSRDTTFDKVRGMMAGSNAYLTKPLDSTALLQAIRKHLPEETGLSYATPGR